MNYTNYIKPLGVVMKKLSLAIAVALAATSASVNAATVYKKDGFTFKIDGDIQIQLRRRVGNNEDFHVDIDDSEIKNKLSYDLGNGLTGFAEAHFDNGKDLNGAVESEETFVGLKTKKVKVKIGRMDYVTDDFATERGIEEPGSAESAFDNYGVSGTDVILFEGKAGPVKFAASHDFGRSDGAPSRNTDLQSTDVYVTAKFGAIQLGAATQTRQATPTATKIKTNGFNAKFKGDGFDVALDTSKSDETGVNYKITNISVAIPVAKTTKITLGTTDESNTAGTLNDSWYANVVYKFPKAKKVSLFAEISDSDSANSSAGFLAGMRVKF